MSFLNLTDFICERISPVITITIPIIFSPGISSLRIKKEAMAANTGMRLAKILAREAPSSLIPLAKRIKVMEDPTIPK